MAQSQTIEQEGAEAAEKHKDKQCDSLRCLRPPVENCDFFWVAWSQTIEQECAEAGEKHKDKDFSSLLSLRPPVENCDSQL